jgi:hypothetical protein
MSNLKTMILRFRVTEDQLFDIRKQAAISGITISDHIRRCVIRKSLLPQIDREMIRELRRQGGLLKLVHAESKGAYSAETDTMLDQISALINEISVILKSGIKKPTDEKKDSDRSS